MSRSCARAALAGMLGIALAGCEQVQPQTDQVAVPEGTVSVYSLAGRLGMRVDQSSRSLALLTSPANRILIFGQPDSRVYVNGRAVGQSGQIKAVEDTLFVPLAMEPQIRAGMRGEWAGPVRPPFVPPVGPPKLPGMVHGTVVIDAGHGGKDPGTEHNGLREKVLNLSVAQMVTEALKARGAKVVMTRARDTFIELEDRADTSSRCGADLFLSIHTNYNEKPWVSGFAVYVANSASYASSSVTAASAIANRLSQAGIAGFGTQPHRAGYRVLVRNSRPAVLLEMGFVSNYSDAANLAQTQYQRKLASAVADGVADYLSRR